MGTISRVTTWSTGDTLTASDLNGEFDNILSTANGSINADNLGVTAGIASALKAVVLDANKDFANITGSNQIRNLTISGSLKIGTTFLPDASGGADLGSATLEWGDLYIADDKYLKLGSDQNINIGYDETTTDSLKIAATEGAALAITLMADEGDDAGDEWKLNVADGGTITLGNDIASAGTYVTHLTLTPHATVASSTLALAGGLTVAGASQFNGTVTVGANDQGYDVILYGDTASAHVMWDTSADKLLTAGGATIDIVKDKLLIGGAAVTTTAAELNFLDTATAGTVVASKAVVVDSNKDIASFRNVTLTGELDAATGDFSGDVDVDGTLEADAITLNGTALGSLYSPIAGSSSIVTVGTIGTGTWQGTAVALAYGGTGLVGATDGKIVIADGTGAPVLLDVGSSTAITVLGTVATGTWQGTAVASAYLDADTAHLSTTQTFSGAKTFSAAAQFSNTVTVGVNDTGYDVKFFGATAGSSLLWDESADDLILTNAGIAVGSDATGDLYYRNASGFLARLGVGDDGQVLTSTGTLPNWEAASGGGGHTIQEEGSGLTQRANLNFVGAGVTATDDSGNDATKITVSATGASMPFIKSDGTTSDPITLTSAAVGESLVSDTTPQLGGNLDVNGQSIVSDASNENIPITPHGTGSVVISKADINGGAIDATAIGAGTPSTIAGTTLSGTGDLTITQGTDTTDGTDPIAVFERTGSSQTGVSLKSNNIHGLILRADGSGFGAIHSKDDLGFYTGTIPGSTYGDVRMRIDAATGNVGIGTTAPAERLTVQGTTTDSSAYAFSVDDSGGTAKFNIRNDGFINTARASNDGSVLLQSSNSVGIVFKVLDSGNVQNTNNSYGSISDIKLKQDITDGRSYWDDFKKLEYKKYRFKRDVALNADAAPQLGLIAQDVEVVFPATVIDQPDLEIQDVAVLDADGEATYEQTTKLDLEGDAVLDDDGSFVMVDNLDKPITKKVEVDHGTITKSVKSSIIHGPIMGSVVQELQARLEAAEAEITALKSA